MTTNNPKQHKARNRSPLGNEARFPRTSGYEEPPYAPPPGVFMLDSTILEALLTREDPTEFDPFIHELAPVSVSAITLYDLKRRMYANTEASSVHPHEHIDKLYWRYGWWVLPVLHADADVAAMLSGQLQADNTAYSEVDVMVSAQAQRYALVIVTCEPQRYSNYSVNVLDVTTYEAGTAQALVRERNASMDKN